MVAVGFTRAYKRLKEQAQELSLDIEVRMLQNGVRAEYRGRKLTFFYKSNVYHDNRTNKHIDFGGYKMKEIDVVKTIFEFENFKVTHPDYPASQPFKEDKSQPVEKPKHVPVITKQNDDKGTQACIDHITEKLEIGRRLKAPAPVITTLITLIDELKQFL